VNSKSGDKDEDDSAQNHVGNGEPWEDQWASKESGDDSPIECNWNETEASDTAKDLVDHNIVGRDPAGESEVAQELSNVAYQELDLHDYIIENGFVPTWEPIPAEADGEDVQKPSVSTDRPSVSLAWVRW
jgi:hypothetical protein